MHGPYDDDRRNIQVRLRGPLLEQLEDWRRSQPAIPSRSQALRRLIEKALNGSDGPMVAA